MLARRPGMPLLVLILALYYLCAYGREAFHQGGPPAFFVEEREGVTVMLRNGFPHPGIHQFYDGVMPAGVIEMTGMEAVPEQVAAPAASRPLSAGEVLDIDRSNRKKIVIKRGWMSASHRMALDIPLHPDRMSLRDWQALPGIGPRLAERIEMDRQENGDFVTLDALDRVSGIGPGRLASWEVFFRAVQGVEK